jgi:hypothetical protein
VKAFRPASSSASASFISIVAYLVVFIAHAFTLIPRCSPSMSCGIFTAGGIGLTEVMALFPSAWSKMDWIDEEFPFLTP